MRIIVATFAALLLAAMPFTGDAAAGAKGKRIVLLTTPNQNPFIGAWNASFIKTAESLGMKVTNYTSPYDAAIQSQQIDDAIAQRFDAIMLIAINHQAVVPALTRAKKAGMPVFLSATMIEDSHRDLFVSYIGADHAELGRIAAEEMVNGLAAAGKTEAKIAAVTGLAPMLNTQIRMVAFKEVLAKHPGIELVAVEDGKWNTALSEKITGELLVRFLGQGGLDGIFGMADNQAAGVVQAIQAAGLPLGVEEKGIIVVGSNCMKEGMINIRADRQFGTATQIPTQNAEATARKIAGYFDGKQLKKYEFLKSYGITKENVAKFEKACTF